MVVLTSQPLTSGRRVTPRADVRGTVAYLSAERVVIARCADVSLTGAFVATRNPDPVGTSTMLRLQMGERSIMIEAEVVRVSFTSGHRGQGAGMGLRFIEMDREQRRFLAAYVAGCSRVH